jgi:hypothetical protein
MLSAIIASIVVTKNQPKLGCFNAAKATFLLIGGKDAGAVEGLRDSNVVTAK